MNEYLTENKNVSESAPPPPTLSTEQQQQGVNERRKVKDWNQLIPQ